MFSAMFRKKKKTADALFQEKLLQLLHEAKDPAEVKRQLLLDPALEKYWPYVEQMDLDMVDVGGQLIKKWGKFD